MPFNQKSLLQSFCDFFFILKIKNFMDIGNMLYNKLNNRLSVKCPKLLNKFKKNQ